MHMRDTTPGDRIRHSASIARTVMGKTRATTSEQAGLVWAILLEDDAPSGACLLFEDDQWYAIGPDAELVPVPDWAHESTNDTHIGRAVRREVMGVRAQNTALWEQQAIEMFERLRAGASHEALSIVAARERKAAALLGDHRAHLSPVQAHMMRSATCLARRVRAVDELRAAQQDVVHANERLTAAMAELDELGILF